MNDPSNQDQAAAEAAVGYVHTTNFPDLLRQLNVSLAVTTYQAQRILFFSPGAQEKLFMLMRVFDRPTGLAVSMGKLAMCAVNKVWVFQAPAEVRDAEGKLQPYDIFFAPRFAYITGDISGHELAFIKDELCVVNTRFSCLCTLSNKFSFVPAWKPAFITELVPEDRCHLNGFAIAEERIRFLSALGDTNVKEGWRTNKAQGGVIIEYPGSEIVARGLSMPHSPRLHAGKLWVLNSGTGELMLVDPTNGKQTPVAKLPGFLRGLTFYGNVAFIGVSKAREKRVFGDLAIEKIASELECAIYAVDIRSGNVLGFIKFTKGIEELFDVQILAGFQKPHILGFEEDTVNGLFILP